ncbi:MAG TPA: alpha/beta fold hydrolase [Gemmatimonadales bacterium]|nr:alpha/beta fold hydrolase [Gemmatimonadales bacterium]
MVETLTREVRGIQLFERRVGTGPAVVVLHGGPGASHEYLLPGFDALAEGRTLIYYDQRGGGQSPVERDVPVGWMEQVADLEALRDCWGLERLTIAGYSWGGLLALLYAVEHPDRVERLLLVSPAPAWREARETFEAAFAERNLAPALQEERRQLRESGLRDSDPEQYQRRLFELSVVPYFHDPALVSGLTTFRLTGRTQKEVWQSLGNYDLRDGLRRLRLPATVMHGESDPIPLDAARTAAECLGAEFHAIAECGHVPYVEQPADFARIGNAALPQAGE